MEKFTKRHVQQLGVKFIGWDLDGVMFDTESQWFKMDEMLTARYGSVKEEDVGKLTEDYAEEMYCAIDFMANADKVLHYLKKQGVHQSLVTPCPLTVKAMRERNPHVLSKFNFTEFDSVVTRDNFDGNDVGKEKMYIEAMSFAKLSGPKLGIAFEDLPADIEGAKRAGLITVWVRNKDYPFTDEELNNINKFADYYIDDFMEIIE
jgi:beta-phosphoglucomutase-like phosphatase (HAD superfamily)